MKNCYDHLGFNHVLHYSKYGFGYDHLGFNHVLLVFDILFISIWIPNLFFDVSFYIMFVKDEHDPILPCFEVTFSFNIFVNIGFVFHIQGLRTPNGNIRSSTYQFEDCFWNLLWDDLWFDRKTLIF